MKSKAASTLVSVYIPTKNRRGLLQRAAESVLSQRHSALELIVVNDGSTDDTQAYLASLQSDERVIVLNQAQSLGAPRARNLAIHRARGEFVTGLDDDDLFDVNRIAVCLAQWEVLERRGERFSCLYTQDLVQDREIRFTTRKPERVQHADLFFHNSIGNQIFTRRQYLLDAGLFDEDMPAWQDLDAFMRLVQRHGPALLVDEPLYVLDIEGGRERISAGSKERIIAAYRRLASKSTEHSPALRQALFLQVFSRLYGFRFGRADLHEFRRHGLHARTLRSLARVMFRQVTGLG
jgi:glycosyltransferase involved in cell wall biosynthesis